MSHRPEGDVPAARSGPLRLVRSAHEGVRWERGDGLALRLAAPEREVGVDRARVSLFGLLLAWAASGAPRR